MKPSTLMLSIVVVLLSVWLIYTTGDPATPEEGRFLILIGVLIAIVPLTLAVIGARNQTRDSHIVGVILTLGVIAAACYILADNPLLWLGLAVVSLPLHLLIARLFYSTQEDLLFSLDNVFQGEFMSPTRKESEAGITGLFYLLSCCALVTAEYKLINFLLSPATGS
ncbi:MAG: hypothetical protein ABW092_11940 [Candidatus Thiodiazotropha sp.]